MIRAFHCIGSFTYELTMAVVRGPEQVTWVSLVVLTATGLMASGWLVSEWAAYTNRTPSFAIPEEYNDFQPPR